jgi:hypothetical protein
VIVGGIIGRAVTMRGDETEAETVDVSKNEAGTEAVTDGA